MVFTVRELSWMFSDGNGILYFQRVLTVTSRGGGSMSCCSLVAYMDTLL